MFYILCSFQCYIYLLHAVDFDTVIYRSTEPKILNNSQVLYEKCKEIITGRYLLTFIFYATIVHLYKSPVMIHDSNRKLAACLALQGDAVMNVL